MSTKTYAAYLLLVCLVFSVLAVITITKRNHIAYVWHTRNLPSSRINIMHLTDIAHDSRRPLDYNVSWEGGTIMLPSAPTDVKESRDEFNALRSLHLNYLDGWLFLKVQGETSPATTAASTGLDNASYSDAMALLDKYREPFSFFMNNAQLYEYQLYDIQRHIGGFVSRRHIVLFKTSHIQSWVNAGDQCKDPTVFVYDLSGAPRILIQCFGKQFASYDVLSSIINSINIHDDRKPRLDDNSANLLP